MTTLLIHEHIINKRTVVHDFLYKRLDIPIKYVRKLSRALTKGNGRKVEEALESIYNHFAHKDIDLEPLLQAFVSDTPALDLLAKMDEAKIDEACPLMIDFMGDDEEWKRVATYFGGLHKKHPRLKPFLGFHPGYRTVLDVINAYKTGDFFGIKIYPPMGVNLNTDEMGLLFDWCQANGVPIISHCSKGGLIYPKVPKSWTSPMKWVDVFLNWPALRVCLAHMGGDFNDWTEDILSWGPEHDGAFFDISSHDDVIFRSEEYRQNILRAVDLMPGKGMIGVDSPLNIYYTMKEFINKLRYLLGDFHFSMMAEENHLEFLGA